MAVGGAQQYVKNASKGNVGCVRLPLVARGKAAVNGGCVGINTELLRGGMRLQSVAAKVSALCPSATLRSGIRRWQLT